LSGKVGLFSSGYNPLFVLIAVRESNLPPIRPFSQGSGTHAQRRDLAAAKLP
jgi:hypothetical protein